MSPPNPSTESPSDPISFDIKDPVELLLLLDDDVSSGLVKLYPWQIQIMRDFASSDHKDTNPFKAVVRAANGSGKDKYIIAACAVWLCMRFIYTKCAITNASGFQLDTQTDESINKLCDAANHRIAPGIWKLNYRYYECVATQSVMNLFATDEPGKAEGVHPIGKGRKLALFQSEAKTVPDDIHKAMTRCSGYTHFLQVSSPGLPIGHFYNTCCKAKMRKDMLTLQDREDYQWIQYHVTAYDCSHITEAQISEIRSLPGGEQSSLFKSSILAEFGDDEGQRTVISYSTVWRAANRHTLGHLKEDFNTAGLDLSLGGDETVLAIRNGNTLIGLEPFKFKEKRDVVHHSDKLLRKWGLDNPNSYIFADAGGLGKPIAQDIRDLGWANMRFVVYQGKPRDGRIYANLIAELWFKFGQLLESGEVKILPDDKLMRQLATRIYLAQEMTQKHLLESKIKAKAKGRLSPDRADAVVMSFTNYKSKIDTKTSFYSDINEPYKQVEAAKTVNDFSLKHWAKDGEEDKPYHSLVKLPNTQWYRKEIERLNAANKKEPIDI